MVAQADLNSRGLGFASHPSQSQSAALVYARAGLGFSRPAVRAVRTGVIWIKVKESNGRDGQI